MTERDWQMRAACRGGGYDPELWFSGRSAGGTRPVDKADREKERQAIRICKTECPVRAECLKVGLREPFGIWGGLGRLERRRMVRADPVIRQTCGTQSGWYAHWNHNEKHCSACRRWNAGRLAEIRAEKAARALGASETTEPTQGHQTGGESPSVFAP